MGYQFRKHYTREEARALLPQVRQWLEELARRREVIGKLEQRMVAMFEQGADLGGPTVNEWVRTMADLQETLLEFQRREILLKDIERGLVDFPAFVAGKEVFLCWEKDEDDIEFWHDIDSGYAGRERL
jgi:hypothetical protein